MLIIIAPSISLKVNTIIFTKFTFGTKEFSKFELVMPQNSGDALDHGTSTEIKGKWSVEYQYKH